MLRGAMLALTRLSLSTRFLFSASLAALLGVTALSGCGRTEGFDEFGGNGGGGGTPTGGGGTGGTLTCGNGECSTSESCTTCPAEEP